MPLHEACEPQNGVFACYNFLTFDQLLVFLLGYVSKERSADPMYFTGSSLGNLAIGQKLNRSSPLRRIAYFFGETPSPHPVSRLALQVAFLVLGFLSQDHANA